MQQLRKLKIPHVRSLMSQEQRVRWQYLPRLVSLLWLIGRREMLLILAFSVTSGLMPLLSVIFLQALVDSAVRASRHTTSLQTVEIWAVALFLANIIGQIGAVAQHWLGDDIQERLKARVQERVLETSSRLPLAAFEQPLFYDQLHRAQHGVDTRLFTIMHQMVPIPTALVTLLSLFIYLSLAHILLPTIIIIGVLPLVISSTRFFVKRYLLERKHSHAERIVQYLGTLLTERHAAAEIRLLNLRPYLLATWQQQYNRLRSERLTLARGEAAMLVKRTVLDRLIVGFALSGVVALIAMGRISLGYFASYLSAVDQFTGALYNLLWNVANTDNDLRYIQDLLDYLDSAQYETAQQEEQAEVPASYLQQPVIQFENVSFTYPGMDRPAIDGINLTFQPNERIALVGENGSGKTTFAKILLGLYNPTSGRIIINGNEIAASDLQWWRKHVAAVFQDYVRYEITVRENITFGNVTHLHDLEALNQAAHQSGADTIIVTLPHGYETILGKAFDDEGIDLSGGQWQKLAVARAYFREANVVVLDEPTASLDARAELEVYRQFRDVAENRVALLISHRLGSARLADRIIVLEKGRIVESGIHATLIDAEGRYSSMYRIQAAWYQ